MTPVPSKGKKGFHLVSDQDTRLGLPVAADEVYAPFGAWMDVKLDEFVAKWVHLAAPNASSRERAIRANR
ncbi:MAG TPA: hypothetical protein VG125_31990 [Pirellulales bacterium]|jgi:hypothetical protein|nr:hypothetical protein [Pirellulales bacterium]